MEVRDREVGGKMKRSDGQKEKGVRARGEKWR